MYFQYFSDDGNVITKEEFLKLKKAKADAVKVIINYIYIFFFKK